MRCYNVYLDTKSILTILAYRWTRFVAWLACVHLFSMLNERRLATAIQTNNQYRVLCLPCELCVESSKKMVHLVVLVVVLVYARILPLVRKNFNLSNQIRRKWEEWEECQYGIDTHKHPKHPTHPHNQRR